jgi:hypothetical protein
MPVFRASNHHGPPPREPYPADDPYLEGPTERLFDPDPENFATQPVPSKGVGFALVLSLIALLVAAGAGLVACNSLGAATARQPAPAMAGQPSSYDVGYAGESLRIQVGCAAAMFLDLDEPRANVAPPDGDLRYDSRCGKDVPLLSLGPGARAGSQVTAPDIEVPGCDQAIRTSPLGPGAGVQAKEGAELCVLTAGAQPRMVLVRITDVTSDGTATLTATSWSVPAR